jgi:predicted RNA-binding Zn-ribbon protein involved in translation (DUF1610 family)
MSEKKNIYVIYWDESALAEIKEELKPGEKAVMRICPDCLKDDDEIIPDKELWRYLRKGEKYECIRCEKEIIKGEEKEENKK